MIAQQTVLDAAQPEAPTIKLDLLGLLTHAAWPVKITVALLVGCSLLVWIIAVLKLLQLGRLRSSERDFDRKARQSGSLADLYDLARSHGAPGARVVGSLSVRGAGAQIERLRAVADRAILAESQSARALMWFLAFIAAAAPFIGLFGTVYGIMDAFIRIGAAKTASLPVVAPAIGLAAAIPAVFFYNWIDKKIGDFVNEVEAGAAEWVALVAEQPAREREDVAAAAAARRSASARPRG